MPATSVAEPATGSAVPFRPAHAAAALAFGILFAKPFLLLLDDWWNNPEAGHGLLLAPVALWLAWQSRKGVVPRPAPVLGFVGLAGAVLLRYLSSLAAEVFTMRL